MKRHRHGAIPLLPLALTAGLGLAAAASAQEEAADLTLLTAVELAQARYPSLRAALAREAATAAAADRAAADRWPQLRAQGSITRFQEPMLVAPLHSFMITTPPQFDETLVRGDLSFAYTLFDGGARGARIGEARAEAEADVAATAAARMALIARAARAYLEVLSARDVDAATARQIEALERERRRVRQFLEEGRAARVELLRVEAALADATARRVTTRARLDLARRELARLIGREPDAVRPQELGSVNLSPTAELDDLSVVIERARQANPDVRRAESAVDAAEANRRLTRSAWWPRLDAIGAYQAFSDPDFDGALEWQAALTVSYPLFTGGARRSAVSAADARGRAARQELRLVELRVEAEVDRALSAALEAAARVEAMELAVQHQAEVARIELLALEAGAGTQTDYLRAEADLLRVRSALVEARNAEIAARIELAAVTGQLDEGWLMTNLETSP